MPQGFEEVDASINLEALGTKLNVTIDEEFGNSQSTYNIHIVCKHLAENQRIAGPLSAVGTWGPESLFKYVRKAFGPGTRNVSKQVLENIHLKEMVSHRCLAKKRKLDFRTKATDKCDDTIAYTDDQKFFKILKEEPPKSGTYLGYLIPTIPFSTEHLGLGMLPWGTVGVHRVQQYPLPDLNNAKSQGLLTWISRDRFRGKGVLVGRTLSSAPQEWASLQMP